MALALRPEEPEAGPWRVEPIASLVDGWMERSSGFDRPRPLVAGLDGRSSSGKSTLARRLAAAVAGAVVVHTDDIAWHQSVLGWSELLIDGVLAPARSGRPVAFRPPAWDARGRPGAVTVPAGAALIVVEGVGASRHELDGLLDATVWVQADERAMQRRNDARLQAGEMTPAGYRAWMAEETAFIAERRPWERVDLIAAGTPETDNDPVTEIVVAPPARAGV